MLEIAFSICVIFLLLPLMCTVAVLIYVESGGPIIFAQDRSGLNGRVFKIFKFRTMTVLEDGDEVRQAVRGDERVTRAGRWLRRTSIDELPQLFNILIGDMSLVGPRPHAVAHDRYYGKAIPRYLERQAVKPGLTGVAQINGARGETRDIDDMKRRVELDLWYIENRNLALDLKILAITPVRLAQDALQYGVF
jgi:lipopolysaccharide/colanic/teichoic acid biosynthesis glycosyltransferase